MKKDLAGFTHLKWDYQSKFQTIFLLLNIFELSNCSNHNEKGSMISQSNHSWLFLVPDFSWNKNIPTTDLLPIFNGQKKNTFETKKNKLHYQSASKIN